LAEAEIISDLYVSSYGLNINEINRLENRCKKYTTSKVFRIAGGFIFLFGEVNENK
jgi:hypothetical protein